MTNTKYVNTWWVVRMQFSRIDDSFARRTLNIHLIEEFSAEWNAFRIFDKQKRNATQLNRIQNTRMKNYIRYPNAKSIFFFLSLSFSSSFPAALWQGRIPLSSMLRFTCAAIVLIRVCARARSHQLFDQKAEHVAFRSTSGNHRTIPLALCVFYMIFFSFRCGLSIKNIWLFSLCPSTTMMISSHDVPYAHVDFSASMNKIKKNEKKKEAQRGRISE